MIRLSCCGATHSSKVWRVPAVCVAVVVCCLNAREGRGGPAGAGPADRSDFAGGSDSAAGSRAADRRIAVGVYFNEGKHYCPDDEQSFADLQQQTGRLAKLYMNFQTWTEEWNRFSTRLADNALAHGGVFMVVWMPSGAKPEGADDPDWTCAAVAAGRHDDYIRRYAADVAAWGAKASGRKSR